MYPLVLHEIDIQSINYFRFFLPPCMADGREDLEVSVDYGADPKDLRSVIGNVWVRFSDSSLKAFLYPINVPDSEHPPTSIVEFLNGDADFEDAVNKYIVFYAKMKQS